VPLSSHHFFTAAEMNSGPLSLRTCVGAPRIAVRAPRNAKTSHRVWPGSVTDARRSAISPSASMPTAANSKSLRFGCAVETSIPT
jgi:hypothetical protein